MKRLFPPHAGTRDTGQAHRSSEGRGETLYKWPGGISGTTVPDSDAVYRALSLSTLVGAVAAPSLFGPNPLSHTRTALLFDGVNDYASRDGSATPAYLLKGAWTVSCWLVNDGHAGIGTIFSYGDYSSPETEATNIQAEVQLSAAEEIKVFWETGSSGTNVELSSGATVPLSTVQFLTVVKEPSTTANEWQCRFYLNGEEVGVSASAGPPTGGSSAKVSIGASFRSSGDAGATPSNYFAGTLQDVQVDTFAWEPSKVLAEYRKGLKPWDDGRLYESNAYHVAYRAQIAGDTASYPGGQWVNLGDLNEFHGGNLVTEVQFEEGSDTPFKAGSFRLRRRKDGAFNLSPLDTGSVLAATHSALLLPRRKVRIETATVPAGWTLRGWEWETQFEGFIDKIEWGDEEVTVNCLDKAAPLVDTYQIEPRQANHAAFYGPSAGVPVQTDLYTIINNNIPAIGGYKGGTPDVYFPVDPGWDLNWVDDGHGPVWGFLQQRADQIGFDIRYKWADSRQSHRLTFFDLPRDRQIPLRMVEDGAPANVILHFNYDHGLVTGQTVVISGTTNFNMTTSVASVLSDRLVVTNAAAVSASDEANVGQITYQPSHVFRQQDFLSLSGAEVDSDSIRNKCVVHYNRVSPTTFSIASINDSGAGGAVQVTADETIEDVLSPGVPVEVLGTSVSAWNTSYVVASIDSEYQFTLDKVIAGAGPVTDGHFTCESFHRAVSVNTASANRYGLREVLIAEQGTSNIDTATEAQYLADSVVADLADPQADWQAEVRYRPWLELNDLISFPDGTRRVLTPAASYQNGSVTRISHTINRDRAITALSLRASGPAKSIHRYRPYLGDRNPRPSGPPILDGTTNPITLTTKSGRIAGNASFQWETPFLPQGWENGRGHRRVDRIEMAVWTGGSSAFPGRSAITYSGRGQPELLAGFQAGATREDFSPKTVYYVGYRLVDIWGRASQVAYADTFTVPFTNRTTARFHAYRGSSNQAVSTTAALLIFNTEVTDTWGDYEAATGIFKAPVDGWYKFHAQVALIADTAGSASADVRYEKNGQTWTASPLMFEDATITTSAKVYRDISIGGFLTAGQTVGLVQDGHGKQLIHHVSSACTLYSYFTGFLEQQN